MATFYKIGETITEDSRGRLTQTIKYIVGEVKELIKHCIQLLHDKGYNISISNHCLKNPTESTAILYLHIEKR